MIDIKARQSIDAIEKGKLYTIKELLFFIPLSKSALYKTLRNEEIPCVKMGGRSLFLGQDILEFIEDCRA